MSEDKLWEVRNWLCHNTAYSITVKIVDLYGCSSFEGKFKDETVFMEFGKDVVKNTLLVYLKLKEHSILSSFDPVADSVWKPIDTAPKDGSRFLAISSDDSQPIVFGHFDTCDGRYYNLRNDARDLTHWAPLPSPPAGSP